MTCNHIGMEIKIRGHRGPGQWILRVYEPALMAQRAGCGETLADALHDLAYNLECHAMDALCNESQAVKERSNAPPYPKTCAVCGTSTGQHTMLECSG